MSFLETPPLANRPRTRPGPGPQAHLVLNSCGSTSPSAAWGTWPLGPPPGSGRGAGPGLSQRRSDQGRGLERAGRKLVNIWPKAYIGTGFERLVSSRFHVAGRRVYDLLFEYVTARADGGRSPRLSRLSHLGRPRHPSDRAVRPDPGRRLAAVRFSHL